MNKYETLQYKVSARIARKNNAVFVREDFKDLGGYDQIGRILRQLASAGKLIRIGYGLYAKAKISPLTGTVVPVLPLPSLAKEAIERLGLQTFPSYYDKEYNAGRSTQVPTGRRIAVKGRISRKIGYNGAYVSYESPIEQDGYKKTIVLTRQNTLQKKIEAQIDRKQDDVFLSREFMDLSGEDQVLRVLRKLVKEGKLVRLGYGVYSRAIQSRLSGEPILYNKNGFIGAVRQTLDKLGVAWELTNAERAYNEGSSSQVPVNPVVKITGRFSRQLSYEGRKLIIE